MEYLLFGTIILGICILSCFITRSFMKHWLRQEILKMKEDEFMRQLEKQGYISFQEKMENHE